MVSGRLCHNKGPMYQVSCPVLVLWKGNIIFANLFLVSILQSGENSKISKNSVLLANLKVIAFMHWWTLSLVGNQFIDLNSARDICLILSNLRQNRLYLCCIICIFFLIFFGKIWVQSPARVVKVWLNKCTAKHST